MNRIAYSPEAIPNKANAAKHGQVAFLPAEKNSECIYSLLDRACNNFYGHDNGNF